MWYNEVDLDAINYLVDRLIYNISMIYWAGGRKFLVTGVLNGALIPSVAIMGKNCGLRIAKWNKIHNMILETRIKDLEN